MSAMKNFKLRNTLPLWVGMVAMIFFNSACVDLQDNLQEQGIQENIDLTNSELLADQFNPNLRIAAMDWTCEEKCVTPNSTQAFRKRGEAFVYVGPNKKTVSYTIYNTFDEFVVEVNTSTDDFDFRGMLRYTISINGQSFELSNLKVGELGKVTIPLEENYIDCGLMEVSIVQTGYGQRIEINDDYNLVKTCEPVNIDDLKVGDTFQGGNVLRLPNTADLFLPDIDYVLIIAPLIISQNAPWGCEGQVIDFSISGASPTAIIASQCQEEGIAAKLVAELEIEGFTDWELPRGLELPFNLPFGFSKVWTSDQHGGIFWDPDPEINESRYAIAFSKGGTFATEKSKNLQVMAVRRIYLN
ncbi:hypothetical protein [Cecembia lonarensis]|uniref:DUF1566 domain-containing protein n=1 Tax=Cecembia lonarensis (strain CCUG 58316 / KCTC 22772 / LW9) TaxID=1225176 RepID=K1LTX9_CECL9|nr:hypothetical protein [Cecembia lonarensis]EKB47594.1 hypothetical protein B879_03802 [Cecembia lonarensis LW9]